MKLRKVRDKIPENPSSNPILELLDEFCKHTKARIKVDKFLGIYLSNKLYTDLCIASSREKMKKGSMPNANTL